MFGRLEGRDRLALIDVVVVATVENGTKTMIVVGSVSVVKGGGRDGVRPTAPVDVVGEERRGGGRRG